MHKIGTYLTVSFFLLSIFFCSNHACAERVVFKPGDRACYTLNQTIEGLIDFYDETTILNATGDVELEVHLLASNPDTLSYPYEVEVRVKKVHFFEVQKEKAWDYEKSTTISYDSEKTDQKIAEYYAKLIDHPLHFRVDGDFEVAELTGLLKEFEDGESSSSIPGIFGTSLWTYKLFLTQLFHLSGEDLENEASYPASCAKFIEWEGDEFDEEDRNDVVIDEESKYFIESIDQEKMQGAWVGNAQISQQKMGMKGTIVVLANVEWNSKFPLLQKRALRVLISEEIEDYFFSAKVWFNVEQSWHPSLVE